MGWRELRECRWGLATRQATKELGRRGNPGGGVSNRFFGRAPGFGICARSSSGTLAPTSSFEVWIKYMNIGLFGGSFDPIHHGHVALARAAKERFELGRIYFVPANVPPHKQRQPLAAYFHRYAMVVLATMGEKAFVPSLLEAPGVVAGSGAGGKSRPAESKIDRLFFLIGIDAFAEVAQWREPEALFRECEFIVASRPGYSLADVANALPEALRPAPAVSQPFAKQPAKGDLVLRGATVHLLENVHQPVSATAIRDAVAAKKRLRKFVDAAVEEYIKKAGLYS